MNNQYQKTSFKTAVLSLSLLTIMSGAGVVPGIYKIAEAFPGTSETVIKLIISLPPLFMIFTALPSAFMEQFMKHSVFPQKFDASYSEHFRILKITSLKQVLKSGTLTGICMSFVHFVPVMGLFLQVQHQPLIWARAMVSILLPWPKCIKTPG